MGWGLPSGWQEPRVDVLSFISLWVAVVRHELIICNVFYFQSEIWCKKSSNCDNIAPEVDFIFWQLYEMLISSGRQLWKKIQVMDPGWFACENRQIWLSPDLIKFVCLNFTILMQYVWGSGSGSIVSLCTVYKKFDYKISRALKSNVFEGALQSAYIFAPPQYFGHQIFICQHSKARLKWGFLLSAASSAN